MNIENATNHLNWKLDFDIDPLVISAMFVMGIVLLLILTPISSGEVNGERDTNAPKKQAGMQGPAGKTPVEIGPAGKSKLQNQTNSHTRKLPAAETGPGDENQPYYIPSPD